MRTEEIRELTPNPIGFSGFSGDLISGPPVRFMQAGAGFVWEGPPLPGRPGPGDWKARMEYWSAHRPPPGAGRRKQAYPLPCLIHAYDGNHALAWKIAKAMDGMHGYVAVQERTLAEPRAGHERKSRPTWAVDRGVSLDALLGINGIEHGHPGSILRSGVGLGCRCKISGSVHSPIHPTSGHMAGDGA